MRQKFLLVALVILAGAGRAPAGVIVVANRTHSAIRFGISPDGHEQRPFQLNPNEVTPIEIADGGTIAFRSRGTAKYLRVDSGSIYFFYTSDLKTLELEEIGFERPETGVATYDDLPPTVTVPVKVLVDDDEQAIEKIWKARLTKRIAAASAIIEHHSRVRFEIVAWDRWESDPLVNQYERSLAEFEKKVDPGAAATIAIGFTSQYRRPEEGSRTHLGGIRGPFRRHILIREWPQHFSEPERLEVLVHEMGHFLGAVHSPEKTSVMRPDLGDRQANDRRFRIAFDPVNTLVMYLVGQEYRRRPLRQLAQMPTATRAQLRAIYTTLAHALPRDPAARRYVQLLGAPSLAPK